MICVQLAVFGGVSRRGASLSFSNDVRLLELGVLVVLVVLVMSL